MWNVERRLKIFLYMNILQFLFQLIINAESYFLYCASNVERWLKIFLYMGKHLYSMVLFPVYAESNFFLTQLPCQAFAKLEFNYYVSDFLGRNPSLLKAYGWKFVPHIKIECPRMNTLSYYDDLFDNSQLAMPKANPNQLLLSQPLFHSRLVPIRQSSESFQATPWK